MKCSIVLSTYNGSKYIYELLDSIRLQSVPAYEVLVCDDCSTDNTVSMIKSYIKEYGLSNWTLMVNQENIGWRQNFKNLIFSATGELIFPCDQDDIWDRNKLEIMNKLCEEHSEIRLLCCDYRIMYMNESVKFPGVKISKIRDNGTLEGIKSKRALLVVDRPGCTYCISKDLLRTMHIIDFDGCPHDSLAWRSAIIDQGLYIVHRELIDFRRHENNASDDAKRSVDSRKEVAEYYINLLSAIKNCICQDHFLYRYINKCICAQEERKRMFESKSILRGIMSVRNISYLPSARTYVADVLTLVRSK